MRENGNRPAAEAAPASSPAAGQCTSPSQASHGAPASKKKKKKSGSSSARSGGAVDVCCREPVSPFPSQAAARPTPQPHVERQDELEPAAAAAIGTGSERKDAPPMAIAITDEATATPPLVQSTAAYVCTGHYTH